MSTPFLPKDFIFGFATAAAQVEGGGAEKEAASGRGDSVSGQKQVENRTLTARSGIGIVINPVRLPMGPA